MLRPVSLGSRPLGRFSAMSTVWVGLPPSPGHTRIPSPTVNRSPSPPHPRVVPTPSPFIPTVVTLQAINQPRSMPRLLGLAPADQSPNPTATRAVALIHYTLHSAPLVKPDQVVATNASLPGKPWWLLNTSRVPAVPGFIHNPGDSLRVVIDLMNRVGFERKDYVRAFWDDPSRRWFVYFDFPSDTRPGKVFFPDGYELKGSIPPEEDMIVWQSHIGF